MLSAKQILESLRKEPLFLERGKKLTSHPLVIDAKDGKLPLKAVGKFLHEQYYIIKVNIKSIEHLVTRYADTEAIRDYFKFFLKGQEMAMEKLLNMAKAIGISDPDLQNYEPQAGAQAYSAYFCLLTHYGEASQLIAAIAMNFPPFGEMCGSLADALKEKYNLKEEDLEFLRLIFLHM